MPEFPESKFLEAINAVVADNIAYLPPYGSGMIILYLLDRFKQFFSNKISYLGGALYIRPILIGTGPRIGLQPSDEYMFIAMVIPVADYYKGGLKPVQALVIDDYDRAAPRGVGNVKVAGNYAADILPNMAAKKSGYPIGLYLDSKTNSFIEEFSTSNFLAIDKKGAYVTPKSGAILGSVTNKSLMQIAEDIGIDVQQRPVHIEELVSGDLVEVAACGTAVVVTPVNKVTYRDKVTIIGSGDIGPIIKSLYTHVRATQNGEVEDKFGWLWPLQSI
jgi:branched-chain amino acid aminotransferase